MPEVLLNELVKPIMDMVVTPVTSFPTPRHTTLKESVIVDEKPIPIIWFENTVAVLEMLLPTRITLDELLLESVFPSRKRLLLFVPVRERLRPIRDDAETPPAASEPMEYPINTDWAAF